MSNEELFDFLKEHLKIKVEDASEPSMFGGESPGYPGVKVTLLIKNPLTGEKEVIDSDKCNF